MFFPSHLKLNFRKIDGEQLRAHPALAKDLDPVPSSHIQQLITACNSGSRGSDALFPVIQPGDFYCFSLPLCLALRSSLVLPYTNRVRCEGEHSRNAFSALSFFAGSETEKPEDQLVRWVSKIRLGLARSSVVAPSASMYHIPRAIKKNAQTLNVRNRDL